jgi:hypothetical protein
VKQYLLSVYNPEDGTLTPEFIERISPAIDVVNEEMLAAGVRVFAGGLSPSSAATVVRVQDGEILTTDGPFVEGKEHVGGFWIVNAPDLDAALAWARKATRACAVPIEVRAFDGDVED